MAKMELTYEQTGMLFFEMSPGQEEDGFKLIEQSEWVDEGKYQYQDTIFEYGGKMWMLSVSRSGSYFSDYYYGFAEEHRGETAHEVEKKEKVTYEWVKVRD